MSGADRRKTVPINMADEMGPSVRPKDNGGVQKTPVPDPGQIAPIPRNVRTLSDHWASDESCARGAAGGQGKRKDQDREETSIRNIEEALDRMSEVPHEKKDIKHILRNLAGRVECMLRDCDDSGEDEGRKSGRPKQYRKRRETRDTGSKRASIAGTTKVEQKKRESLGESVILCDDWSIQSTDEDADQGAQTLPRFPLRYQQARGSRRERSSSSSPDRARQQRTVYVQESRRRNRNVPKPAKFEIYSGNSLTKFFERYERYCSCQFSDEKDDWVELLGEFLEGEMKQIYRNAKKNEKPYHHIKAKLIDWYAATKRTMGINKKQEFENARMRPGESVFSYAFRLQELAETAFPDIPIEENRELKKKFANTAPTDFVKFLREQNIMKKELGGENITWKQVKVRASVREDHVKSMKVKATHGLEQEDYLDVNFTQTRATREKTYQRQDGGDNPDRGEWKQQSWRKTENRKPYEHQETVGAQSSYRGNFMRGRGRGPRGNNGRGSHQGSQSRAPPVCYWCEKPGHLQRDCYVMHRCCYSCGGEGHFVRECPSRGNCGGRGNWKVRNESNTKLVDNGKVHLLRESPSGDPDENRKQASNWPALS